MKNETEIRALLVRYDEGLTNAEEERTLAALLAAEEELPRDLAAVAMLLEGVAALREEELPRRLAEATPKPRRRWMGWVAAAVVAAGLFVAIDWPRDPYCYINGVAIYDAEDAWASTTCLARLEHLDRSMELFDQLLLTTENE